MNLENFLSGFISNLPALAVAAIGALYALLQWSRAPRAALLVMLGCLVMLAVTLVHPILFHFLMQAMQEQGAAGQKIATTIAAFNFVMSLVRNAGLAAVIVGAFIDRGYAPAQRVSL